MLIVGVCLFLVACAVPYIFVIKQNQRQQKEIFESLKQELKEFQRIPALLTSPQGLKTIGEKNLEFLLTNVLPKDFVIFQHEMIGVGVADTALKIGERFLCIDSKFPKYREDRKELCSAVKDRIREAEKYISPKHNTFPFVLMFVPAEQLYYQAFVEDVDMMSYAMARNVVPVSPATLYAYLCVLMDSVKRIEFAKNEKNVLQTIKQSLNIFDGAKSSVDRATKQMRDSLTNAEGASKKIQDCLDSLNSLVRGDEK